MKKPVLAQATLVGAFLMALVAPSNEPSPIEDTLLKKIRNTTFCTPDRSALSDLLSAEPEIPLMPGSGSYVWKINTTSDSAQYYFNQGINTYYGFHIIESLASFKKAAKFDPDNPMVWWGQALAYGPNINDVAYNVAPEALAATRKALSLIEKASPVDQELIRAMAQRYSEDKSRTMAVLNQEYTDAMKSAYENHPQSADVLALYADAMMLQHPWDLWLVNGTPRPWTPLIQEVLEKGLEVDPNHPGVNHYYIHVIEPSPNPEKAKASADRLGSITPGLAHLVHMPSHIYLRTGEFNKGVAINQDAVKKFREYKSLFPAVEGGAFIYYLHNQHMLVNCAMHAGKYKIAIDAANELYQSIDSATLFMEPPMGSLMQYIHMSPVLINVRFEKWDSLKNMEKPDNRLVYANIIYHFGKGFAHAAGGNIDEAKGHAANVKELLKHESLKLPMTPFSSAIEGAVTASEMLDGIICLKENKFKEGIKHLTLAAETEQKMVYNEPRDWFLNPHQYLGMAYLMNRDYSKAEDAFRKDLKINANNVWSLYRLQETLLRQNATKKTSGQVSRLFEQARQGSDVNYALLKF